MEPTITELIGYSALILVGLFVGQFIRVTESAFASFALNLDLNRREKTLKNVRGLLLLHGLVTEDMSDADLEKAFPRINQYLLKANGPSTGTQYYVSELMREIDRVES